MYINTAEEISGIPSSWPGYDLTIGSSGNKVLQMQEQLNVIAEVYSSIPTVYENGYFDEETQDAVEAFQRLFRPAGFRHCGLSDVVQNPVDLCGCDEDCGAAVGIQKSL